MVSRRAVWLRIIGCFLVCFGVLTIFGCGDTWLWKPVTVASQPPLKLKKSYQQAVAMYFEKQYDQAAQQFESVREQTTDKLFAHMALYGVACSRLMAANTPREYGEALKLWEKWTKQIPEDCGFENPIMFDPLIKEKMIFSNIPLSLDKIDNVAPSDVVDSADSVPRWLLIKSNQELYRLKNELYTSQQTIEKREKKIQVLERDINALKGQIKALETIDQKIQKKKNAIPSTDSPSNGELK